MSVPAPHPIEWLYRNHYGGLHTWLLSKLGHAGHAAELAHDTFLRMLTRGPDLASTLAELREPRAYLRAIAKGLLADHWRRQTLEQAYLDALALQPETLAPSPEDRALILEALEQVARLLDSLKPRMRTAFLLAQIEGRSHQDIAAQMGVSVRTIERYMAEALYQCHRALRAQDLQHSAASFGPGTRAGWSGA